MSIITEMLKSFLYFFYRVTITCTEDPNCVESTRCAHLQLWIRSAHTHTHTHTHTHKHL